MTVRLDRANPPKIPPGRLACLKAMTPEEIQRNAEADPDNPPLTEEEADRIIFARAVERPRAVDA